VLDSNEITICSKVGRALKSQVEAKFPILGAQLQMPLRAPSMVGYIASFGDVKGGDSVSIATRESTDDFTRNENM